jgi:cell division protein ZapE
MRTVLASYQALVLAAELKADSDQRAAAERLSRLQAELEAAPKQGSLLARLLGRTPAPPRGLYLWGGVGRGKSMLMDLLRDCLDGPAKRRIHFHEFMLDVHARLREERRKERGDPVAPVAAAIASEVRVLLFDEMIINNTADAALMSRLFAALLDRGVTLVTTSNRPPEDLYKDGINRGLVLPFIALLKERLDILSLNGPTDYRLERLGGKDVWHVPHGERTTAELREIFFRLTDYPPEDAANVPTEELPLPGGRILHVPKSLKGVAVFSFRKLCREARGASDYLAIARRFHTVFLVGVPILGPDNRDEAARFVTLIDELYEHKVKLIAGAAALPQDLYREGDGKFEFERTVSRLIEMQSDAYLALGHGSQGDRAP